MLELELEALKESQKQYFHSGITLSAQFRRQQLLALKKAVKMHEAELQQALYDDLGKPAEEAYMSEIGLFYQELNWQLRHLNSNMAVHHHLSPLHQFPADSMTVRIPYGNVLILSPWNYPFLLAFAPLCEAIAAGNTAILHPGHYSENTTRVMSQIISSTFDPDYIALVSGGRKVIADLLELDFDYIFFTGGTKLGKLVMEKAAAHLCPVSLELGGKSPAIVDESANLPLAARRIVFGKLLNAGQTCVAPDYVLVQESVAEPFLALLKKEIEKQMPNPANMGKIITPNHFDRLCGLIEGQPVYSGGQVSVSTRQIEPTILYPADWESPAMQEEIFGPILPVLTFQDFREVRKLLQDKPSPLALYLFTRSPMQMDWMKLEAAFGDGCINDTVIQLSVDALPFGGMKQSGMGQYHGKYGFDTFSHVKGIVKKGELDLPMRYADAPQWMRNMVRLFLK